MRRGVSKKCCYYGEMNFKRFTILKSNEAYQQQEQIDLLINLDHLVSVKPIKMTTPDQRVVEGYWLRLSNGKKYKATAIPKELTKMFNSDTTPIKYLQDEQILEDQLQ